MALSPSSLMKNPKLFLILALLPIFASAQNTPADPAAAPADPAAAELSAEAKKAADLEAKLRQTLESSPEGARILLELTDLYYQEGEVFGLVRSTRQFINSHIGHPRHEEVMWKLMEGLMIASRGNEIKSTGLQFLDRYPNSQHAAEAHRALAQVFDREGNRMEAANHFRGVWERLGKAGINEAEQAFRHYYDLRNPEAAKHQAEMALKILDQLPPNAAAAQFTWYAMYSTRTYGAQHTLSNQVGAKALQKNVAFDARQKWEIPYFMGDSYRAEQQYANAINSYRLAIANKPETSEVHRQLIRSIYDSQGNFNDLQAAVNAYVAAWPNETVARTAEMKNYLAQAKARDGDIPGALEQARLVLREHGGLAASFFQWAKSTADEARTAPAAALATATAAMTANTNAQPGLDAAVTAAKAKADASKKAAADAAAALQNAPKDNPAAMTQATNAKNAADAASKADDTALAAATKAAADHKAKAPGLAQAVATAQTNLNNTVGAKWQVGEQIYQQAVQANPENVYVLHYNAAFTFYRDFRLDNNTAKNLLRAHLLYPNPIPPAGGEFSTALQWILDQSANDAEFQAEFTKFIANAKLNGHNTSYTRAPEQWLNANAKTKDDAIRARYNFAQGQYDQLKRDPTLKLWETAAQNQMRGHAAREQLLKGNLTQEQRVRLLGLHAYDLRQYGNNDQRIQSLAFYEQLGKLEPNVYAHARAWIEAASAYADPAQARVCLEHILRLQQDYHDYTGWYYASLLARKTEDKAMMTRVLAWIRQNQAKVGATNHYASTIIGNLTAMEMQDDAIAYMNECIRRDPDYPDTATALSGLFQLQEPGQARIAFITPYLAQPSDNHGQYSFWLADEYLKLGDFANYDRVTRQARARQDERLLRPSWSWGSGSTQVNSTMANEEWTAEQKLGVYRAIRDMNYGRESAVAQLAILTVEGHTMTPIQRLRAYRDTTMEAQKDATSYSYLNAWAQRAMARDEHAEAAALATGLLNNIASIGVDTQEQTRAMIREAYGKMGALGMEVSADNPVAPLLEIGLHLRLADRDRALEAYAKNEALFNEYFLELPAELVAFAADSHIAAGGEENHDRAEEILRKWMVTHSESDKFTDSEKARMQLLLAKNYDRGKRYEVARGEYTTVVNRWPDVPEAIEARFGIGETLMAQKIYDQAEETFEELSNSPIAPVRIRGMFLKGVLEGQKGNNDEARDIFRDVLGSMPDVTLANEALYNLSEVYGGEQRFLEQLELLRTVGRLGQESKRWHEPGRALSIVVQDSDLGISRGHQRIPVEVTTVPGGDVETAFIVSGGAGKGLFIGEIQTGLGVVEAGNGTLEVGGDDLIKVDYPADFKKEFQFQPIATGDIGLAADADFTMASHQIIDEVEETQSERLEREEAEQIDLRRSASRPDNEIKPGNIIYIRVDDYDRDRTAEADAVMVKLTASSGDEVQATLVESGPHTGRFEGTVETSDLPAGALASDTAIEHSPLMAIDKDQTTAWVSQPDGLTPKFLSVDLKDLVVVNTGVFTTPNPVDQAPVRARLQGSHDGRFWYPLAEHPVRETVEAPPGEFIRMTERIWEVNATAYRDWDSVLKLAQRNPDSTDAEVDELEHKVEYPLEEEARRTRKAQPATAIWQGTFIQPRAGAVRFSMQGQVAGAMINGMVQMPVVPVTRNVEFDVYLEAGLHQCVFFASTTDAAPRPISVTRARENPNISQVRPTRFVLEDFELTQAFVADLKPAGAYTLGTMSADEEGNWKFDIAPRELRHVRLVIDEYVGQAVAINNVVVAGPKAQYIPTEADLLLLSTNNILELTPGDVIESTYIDELPNGGNPRNRALTQNLKATYYNGTISPIAYDFVRDTNGQVTEITKDLLRIDPGERITIEVVDYDMDSTGQEDTVELKVQVGDGQIETIVAHETEPTSGIFKTEIDTYDPDAPVEVPAPAAAGEVAEAAPAAEGDAAEPAAPAEPEFPRLAVKSGHQIFLTYRDAENTFPGHAIDREAIVYVRAPTDGKMRIIETRASPPIQENGAIRVEHLTTPPEGVKGVAYEVPLTVEVIDPDAARDSLSTVVVQLNLVSNEAALKAYHEAKAAFDAAAEQAPKAGEPAGDCAPGDEAAAAVEPPKPPKFDPAWLPVEVQCSISTAFSELDDTLVGVTNPALHEGRFVGQVLLRLGGPESPRLVPRTPDMPANLIGRALPPKEIDALTGELVDRPGVDVTNSSITIFNVTGAENMLAKYVDPETTKGEPVESSDQAQLLGNAELIATDSSYEDPVEKLQVGERVYLRLTDPDKDSSAERDRITIEISTSLGELETVSLEETLTHSGVFTGSFKLKAETTPTPNNFDPAEPQIEAFFGEQLLAKYVDDRPSSQNDELPHQTDVPVSDGTDGDVAAFTKMFGNEDLAIQTQFHIAESFFELFKSHLALERADEANADLKNGRRILKELQEDYPDPKYAPRVAYLLGQYSQELKDWDDAILNYETIVRQFPDHSLAADAQYKLGQCYEEAERFDDALEAYVTLAATYPQNPLISNVMIRINEYFYRAEDYVVAAQVGEKFLERFESHEWAPRMSFRVGQCFYKAEQYVTAGLAFDDFLKRFPEDNLSPQALFWAGESYREANNIPFAFRRYNRCRWDFPESDAAKFARGRLALPEMLAQFEAEARGVENESQ